jgi:hypothetical protein
VVRYAAAANTCYRFTADHAASNNVDISRIVAGARVTVVAFTQAWSDGDTWRFDVTGPSNAASLRLFLNGTMIQQATDTSSIASGTPGIFFGDNVDITSWSADTWSGGTVNTENVAWFTA